MWKLKVLIQFILAKLPGGERINYLLQHLNNRHSAQSTAKRVLAYSERLAFVNSYKRLEGSTVVEIGTGWDALTAVLFYFVGAKVVYTFDHLPHARLKVVQEVVNQIAIHMDQLVAILSVPKPLFLERLKKLQDATSLQDLFSKAGIHYQAPGDAACTGLPDHCADLVYSYAVLEHVPETVVERLTIESKRLLKPTGIAFHGIGLHDHYVSIDRGISKVNFLQYPEWLWRFFVKNNISYHNRLREKEFVNIFQSLGGKILRTKSEIDAADVEILKTMKVDKRFQGMTPEEMAVYYTDVVLTFEQTNEIVQPHSGFLERTHVNCGRDRQAA